jgi:hypothetical protein
VAAIFRALPGGGPFALALRVPGISWFAEQMFAQAQRYQAEIGTWFGLRGFRQEDLAAERVVFDDSIARRVSRYLTLWREVAAAFALAGCAMALIHDMGDDKQPTGIEASIYPAIAYPRIFQRWGLFTPDPAKRPGMLVAEGQTAGGARLDPFTGLSLDVDRSGTRDPRAQRPDPLMGAYFTNISQPRRADYVGELREYVRRLFDRRESKDKLVWFNVDWIESPIAPPEASPASPPLAVGPGTRRITSGP